MSARCQPVAARLSQDDLRLLRQARERDVRIDWHNARRVARLAPAFLRVRPDAPAWASLTPSGAAALALYATRTRRRR